MKRTWVRFEAVMKQGSEGEMAALPPGNPEGEKRGTGAVKRSTKLCSGESQSEKHDEARDYPRACGENGGSAMRRKRARKKKRFSWISATAYALGAIVKVHVVYTHGHHLLPVVVALLHELSKTLHHQYSLLR